MNLVPSIRACLMIKKLYPQAKFDEAVRRHRVEITYQVEVGISHGSPRKSGQRGANEFHEPRPHARVPFPG